MDSELSSGLNTQALKISLLTGVTAGLGALGIYQMMHTVPEEQDDDTTARLEDERQQKEDEQKKYDEEDAE